MTPLLPTLARATVGSTSRAFTTSAIVAAKGTRGGPAVQKKTRTGTGFNRNKGQKGAGGRAQAGGLQLKTGLASAHADLTDLVQLYPESVVPLNVGKVAVFPRNTHDQLKTFGMPRRLEAELGHGSPASVIRETTLNLVGTLEGAKAGSSKDARLVLSGDRGSGKSMLLLQAVSYAIESGWIVLYVPQASRWIDSSSSYAYDTASQTFHQPAIAADLLDKLLNVNRDRLASITLPAAVTVAGHTLNAGDKFSDLVALGARDTRVSVPVLEAVLAALATQTQFPVLVAVDEVQALFQQTKYRAPDYSLLESYSLSTPRLVLDYLSARKNFANGVVLGAVSNSSPDYLPKAEFLAGLDIQSRTPIHPYTKMDEHHLAHAKSGMKRVDVPFGMSGDEAAAMFELWTRKGWTSNASDEVFLGGLTASSGNPGELARGWTLTHQSYII